MAERDSQLVVGIDIPQSLPEITKDLNAIKSKLASSKIPTFKASIEFDEKKTQSDVSRALQNAKKSATGKPVTVDVQINTKKAEGSIGAFQKKISNSLSSISTKINALKSLGDLSVFKNPSTAGIQSLSNEIQRLLSSYGTLQSELQGGNISSTRYDELITDLNSLDRAFATVRNQASVFDGSLKGNQAIQKLRGDIEIASNKLLAFETKWSAFKSNPTLLGEFRELQQHVQNIVSESDWKAFNQQFANWQQKVKAANRDTKDLWTQTKENFKKFGAWLGIGSIETQVVQYIKKAINNLKEVDTLLTEISKTSDRTRESLEKLGKTAFDTASKYGATAKGYLEAVREMSRAGFGEGQSEQLGEVSLLAQTAGDMNAETANQYLLATNAAYKLEGNARELTKVLDGQNQVTNRNAINMEKLAGATMIAGAQAAQSGVQVDQLTGAVGTMAVVTQQSGEVAGRAFKALLMNLQQVKGELEDGDIIDEEALSKSEAALDSVGIKLKEVRNGTIMLRDPMKVLKELSVEFNKLDKMDARRSNIISALGGKYRGNQVAALLTNWDIYEKILSDFQNSSGSAMREAQKTADSWEGKLNSLSNAWTSFVQNFIDSNGIKLGLLAITKLLELLDGVPGRILAIIATVIVLSGALKTLNGTALFTNISGIFTSLVGKAKTTAFKMCPPYSDGNVEQVNNENGFINEAVCRKQLKWCA